MVTLKLIPVNNVGDVWSHTLLDIERDSQTLLREIAKLSDKVGVISKAGIICYLAVDDNGENSYGRVVIDLAGLPIKYIFAKQLNKLLDGLKIVWNWKDLAIMGYIRNCPDDLKIYLYWGK